MCKYMIFIIIGLIGCQNYDYRKELNNSIFIPHDIVWETPPPLESTTCYSSSNLIYFDSSGYFKFIRQYFYKQCQSDTISLGAEGWIFYGGEWKISNNVLIITYRLLDRTIKIAGEEIPSEIIVDSITINDNNKFILFNGNDYIKYEKFTPDALKEIKNLIVFERFK